ncbi:flagellar hook protein FlgE [Crenobacter sp. SG2305]|uniref:flagellar hook protein FlgE n=1 Tax=Crenobacter oryzisoli TaxID=3056844 RepID=UPI0025AA544C|nr:flagellar hook protein FlgE [Crenobacter sp. SG2305]MDN0082257.1 flagellar hook protein FlgE [Crenobacter sp. SG2305]
MGFQQALSGVNAASQQLSVIGNNVANASTVGFKGSRAEFADMYANGFSSGAATNQAGIGVQVAAVTQGFNTANITSTGRNLDLAINGNGFFIVKDPTSATTANSTGSISYTRDGEFQQDKNGYIVNGTSRLQGWMADANGNIVPGPVGDLILSTSQQQPKGSTKVDLSVNLNSASTSPAVTPLDPTNSSTYNYTTSTNVYDSLGNTHVLNYYYVKDPVTPNTWSVSVYADGSATALTPAGGQPVTFNSNGTLATPTTPFTVSVPSTTGSSSPFNVAINLTGTTQFASQNAIVTNQGDGYPPGQLTSFAFDKTGVLTANYSNGQTKTVGQLALATFANPQGLQQQGGNRWTEGSASGSPAVNVPGASNAGLITASALEDSNVDLTSQLVDMITAQRYYQANAQTIKTEDQVMQTLINLR